MRPSNCAGTEKVRHSGFQLFSEHDRCNDNSSMAAEELNDVLELEKKAREYPSDSCRMDFFDDFDDDR